jgi:3'-phosphoadenosine 5'-phosphosulfate sulfotransferase (PAPS reductase)/FAD synthetase
MTQLFELSAASTATAQLIPLVEVGIDEKIYNAKLAIKVSVQLGHIPVVACSFGKDSSVTLALTLQAMQELKAQGFKCPTLHVMHSNTLLENPEIDQYTRAQIKALKAYGESSDIPIKVWVASPGLSNNYLVNIIGGRTIATFPDNDRKCQQMMKKAPLERCKRQIKAFVRARHSKYWSTRLLTIIGNRKSESKARSASMADRGESAAHPVNISSDAAKTEWTLSPIADFTEMDVFTLIGMVRSGRFQTYSDFEALTDIYRDINNGECMVNLHLSGQKQGRTACGARTGCWICLAVQDDRSMENMLMEESGRFSYLRPLNDFRNWIKARHYDPRARNWLARQVHPERGTVKIAANAYSPQHCLDLLRFALTIQREEELEADRLGIEPRFILLTEKEILAIDLLFGRYGYTPPLTALQTYYDIYHKGMRYPIPDTVPSFEKVDMTLSAEVPFADEEYDHLFCGLRNSMLATTEAEELVSINGQYYTATLTDNEYTIYDESVEFLFGLDLEYALKNYGPKTTRTPSASVHYILGMGYAALFKGSQREWDRMLRMSNQIYRHGIQDILNDPVALISHLAKLPLTEASAKLRAQRGPDDEGTQDTAQMSLFG